MPEGAALRRPMHERVHDGFYVLEGEITYTAGPDVAAPRGAVWDIRDHEVDLGVRLVDRAIASSLPFRDDRAHEVEVRRPVGHSRFCQPWAKRLVAVNWPEMRSPRV
jgi:hypothetical protein